jgi:hypothetical protein
MAGLLRVFQAAHGLYAACWVTLVTFGSVRDVRQIRDSEMNMDCADATTDISCPDPEFPYPFNSEGCCTSQPYDTTYKIMHLIGGALGLFQVFYGLSLVSYHLLFRWTKFVFIFRTQVQTLLWVTPFITSLFIYQHLVYRVLFCGYDTDFCKHSSDALVVIERVFMSLLTFAIVFFVLQSGYVGIFVWTFLTKRRGSWSRIIEIERSLFFDDAVRDILESRGGEIGRTFDLSIQEFVEYWTHKTDDNIISQLPEKTECVMRALGDRMDLNFDGKISHAEFTMFCIRNNIVDRVRLWTVLTLDNTYDVVTRDSVEDMLYELFFHRKQLAYAIHSDRVIITSIWGYASITLYPGCFIVVSRIFQYEDAFSNGIDLFKTYAAIVSYIYSQLMDNLRFLVIMLQERPFNIGDVLDIDGSTYAVDAFNTTHTMLTGRTKLTVTNTRLIQDKVINLTRKNVMDSFDVRLPLNARYGVENMTEAIHVYVSANPRDVRVGSVRCEWTSIEDGSKVLRCYWRYKFPILDRSRLNKTRTNILNCLVDHCNEHIIRSHISEQVASGGGLNDIPHVIEYAKKEW